MHGVSKLAIEGGRLAVFASLFFFLHKNTLPPVSSPAGRVGLVRRCDDPDALPPAMVKFSV